ncbi:hypothetical protein ACFZAV_45045 [Streptomyces sp. NPDC008343]|uniref:hypothetical protein n=1 Tax=Streptomyces sp. NPDC008343 TaxID=3364828 RepID=UPI0036E1726A
MADRRTSAVRRKKLPTEAENGTRSGDVVGCRAPGSKFAMRQPPCRASTLRMLTEWTSSQLVHAFLTQHADPTNGSSENKSTRAFGTFHHPSDATLDRPQSEVQLSTNRRIRQTGMHEFQYVDIGAVQTRMRATRHLLRFVLNRESARIQRIASAA